MKYVLPLIIGLATIGCVHPKLRFHKKRILDPMMDPAKTEGFHSSMTREPVSLHERGSADVGDSVGGTCPTCGG